MALTIKYVYCDTIAFTIGVDLFYLRTAPNIPQIFDQNEKPQIIPNLDSWILAKTQQRYSYQSLLDMAAAFAAGLSHSYTATDLDGLCRKVVQLSKSAIFHTEYATDFSRAYWIELLDPGKLQKFVESLRSQFQQLREEHNDNELYNILCRLWQFCNFHAPSESAVFEAMIQRMGRKPQPPTFSAIDSDRAIEELVLYDILKTELSEFKNISNELVDNVKRIQSRGLSRS